MRKLLRYFKQTFVSLLGTIIATLQITSIEEFLFSTNEKENMSIDIIRL